jgi:Protein of unknown function (DUF4012)
MSVGVSGKHAAERERLVTAALTRLAAPSRRQRTITFGVAVVAVAVGAGGLSLAEPTGLVGADVMWSAALAAIVAYFGGTARRWTWFLPAGVAAVVAADGVAVACAAAAIAIGFWSVLRDTRTRARGAVVAGLGCIALLRAEPVGFDGLTAILMAAVATPVIASGYAHAGRRVRRRARRIALVVGGLFVVMVGCAALGAVSVLGDLTDGARAIDAGLRAARDADDEATAEQLGAAARHLSSANATLSSWFVSPAKILPIVGPNISAVQSLSRQASDVAEVSSLAASDADVDSLRFVNGRLDPAAVSQMIEPLQAVQQALHLMQDSVDGRGSPWLVAPVADRIDLLDNRVDEAVPDADTALLAVETAPELLGADGDRRYLVLFTTPAEARGRTGFPGNFAELVLSDGKLSMPRFGRISELEHGGVPGAQKELTAPADYVARYQRFDVATTWRNITMSPDLPSIAAAAAELYPQSGGQKIDGVLAVDPIGLAALMRYTGNIDVEGLDHTLTADNVAGYLLHDQYVQFEEANEQRVDVLEEVARTTFDRLTSADLPGPRALGDALDPVVDAGHIQFTPRDTHAALALYILGVTGAMPVLEKGQDSLTVTTSNAGANKIDVYLERTLDYRVHWDPAAGHVTATLRLQLTNTAPAEGLPDYVIGNSVGLPPGTNRSFVSIYSPYRMTASRIDGRPVPLQSEVERNRNVYSTFVSIPSGGTVTVEVDLTGTLEGRRYELVLPPESLVAPDRANVAVEVAGGADAVGGESDEIAVDGGSATWSGPMDRTRTLAVVAAR